MMTVNSNGKSLLVKLRHLIKKIPGRVNFT